MLPWLDAFRAVHRKPADALIQRFRLRGNPVADLSAASATLTCYREFTFPGELHAPFHVPQRRLESDNKKAIR